MMNLDTAVSLVRLFLIDLPWLILYLLHTNLTRAFRCVVPKTLKSLKTEIILITGSANGLGREICLALAKAGATTLVCWDVDKRRNEELVRIIRDTGTNAYSYILDISMPASIKANAERVRSEVGHVSMIINNAGVFALKPVDEYSSDEIENMFKINVMSHFWILREFLPNMVERKHGHVVAIASGACNLTPGLISCYASTKHAIHGLMESLRDEIFRTKGGPDIKITTVYPHIMQTNMTRNYKVNFRFPTLSKFLDPALCAKSIVDGIRRNEEYIDIPYFRATILKHLASMLPPKIMSSTYSVLGITQENVEDGNIGRTNNDQWNKPLLK